MVFFADEGGSWQVGVDWKSVLPADFRCLAETAGPEEFARKCGARSPPMRSMTGRACSRRRDASRARSRRRSSLGLCAKGGAPGSLGSR